jgi:hypothetical protein
MQHGEYERRRRALEEQCHADLELVRSAYEAKIRALETLWLISPEVSALPAGSAALLPAKTSSSEAPSSLQPEQTPAPPAPATVRGQARAEIEAALPSLPEIFNKQDIVRALGYEPSRPTLNRAFSHLLQCGRIVVAKAGLGNTPSTYRRL